MRRMASTPARMVAAVLVTCVASASALTVTYALTKDRIAEQERAAEEAALRAVLPDAASFDKTAADIVDRAAEAAGETPVTAVYEARNGGATVGYAVRVSPRGYGGPMQMVVGLDRDGKVTGASIITQNETPGLGSKIITEEGFLSQFAGWDGTDIGKAAKAFDAISGATKSSNGVRKGVLAAGHVYAEVLAGISTDGGSQQ